MSTAKTAAEKIDQSSAKNIKLLFIGLMVTMLLASLNQTVLSTALPTIVGELDGVNRMTWVITGYILAATIMMPVYGSLSDVLGRKPVILTAILLFLTGSVIGGLAGNIEWLIIGRIVQGIGGGGLIILSQAAIADVVPARERGKYAGVMGGVFAVSSVVGPLLGGWLTEGPGWRWAFWINIPLGILAVLATVFLMRLPKVHHTVRPKIDYLGMALVAGATTAIVLICTWGGSMYAWVSPEMIGLMVVTVVLGGVFAFTELRVSNPIIPMTLFQERNFVLVVLASLMLGVPMFGVIGYMPTYIQMVAGVDATHAGLLMIPMMGGLLVASVVSGQRVSRTGKYKLFPVIGSVLVAVGLALLATLHLESETWLMCAYLAMIGAGLGLSLQILTLIVQNAFSINIVGTATAAVNYFRQVGATVGSAVVGSVFSVRLIQMLDVNLAGLGAAADTAGSGLNSLTPASVNAMPEAIRTQVMESYNEALLPIFLWMVPLAVIAFIALLFVREKPLATTIDREQPGEAGLPLSPGP